ATPATCGVAIDVPLKRLKSRFPCAGVCATAARISWPGAITSGFNRSPRPANCGPRDENDAVNGAGVLRTIGDWLIVAVGFVVAEWAIRAARSVSATCTLGTKWKSAFNEFGVTLA